MTNKTNTTSATKQDLMDVELYRNQLDHLNHKSSQIRYLYARGLSRGQIQKVMSKYWGKEVRYQHVRNVLIQPIEQVGDVERDLIGRITRKTK